jgi:hypothetical protein
MFCHFLRSDGDRHFLFTTIQILSKNIWSFYSLIACHDMNDKLSFCLIFNVTFSHLFTHKLIKTYIFGLLFSISLVAIYLRWIGDRLTCQNSNLHDWIYWTKNWIPFWSDALKFSLIISY